MPEYVEKPGRGAAVKNRAKLERPHRYKVLLHNDDYTSMDFVVEVLENIFRRPRPEAVRIMLNVHEHGIGVAGVYVKPIAEAKVDTAHKRARDSGFPLRCSMQRE